MQIVFMSILVVVAWIAIFFFFVAVENKIYMYIDIQSFNWVTY